MDYLIELVGDFGRFQYKATFIVGLISALSSACMYATIFIAAEPDLLCHEKNLSNNNLTRNNSKLFEYKEKCSIWSNLKNSDLNNSKLYECAFDTSIYGRTIITEWDLVCDRQFRAGLTQTIHILGSIFGFFGGFLGDHYGRRRSVLIFSFLLTITLLISQFLLLNNFRFSIDFKYLIYTISQFLIGLLVNCLYCTSYVLLMEFTTDKYRTSIANINSYIYVLGELIVLVVYYITQDWHKLNWFIGLFSLIIYILSFYLLESPSWLISIDQNEEALNVLKKIAKTNGVNSFNLSMTIIETIKLEEDMLKNDDRGEIIDEKIFKLKENEKNNKRHSNIIYYFIFKDIFTPKKIFIRTSLLFYIWAALMLLYYGISLGVTTIDLVDPYLMYFLSALAELIGYIFCYLNDVFGRKKTMLGSFVITTAMYGVIAYLSMENNEESSYSLKAILLMVFGLIGKCAISACYHIAYIFTSELYPTHSRNTALLFLTCFGGLSSLVAPQINKLKILIWNPLPYIIYSSCALLGCFCVFYLPETHKKLSKK